jgi:hypothetical protein
MSLVKKEMDGEIGQRSDSGDLYSDFYGGRTDHGKRGEVLLGTCGGALESVRVLIN